MNEFRIYNRAVKRVMEREILKRRENAKTNMTYEQATRRFKEKLEETKERVLNGEKIKVLKLTKKTALNNKEYYFE